MKIIIIRPMKGAIIKMIYYLILEMPYLVHLSLMVQINSQNLLLKMALLKKNIIKKA